MAKIQKSYYQAASFHAVRTLSFLSNAIVTGVLVYFLLELKGDGFKLPWTMLIVLAVSLVTVLYLLISYCVHLCGVVSPLLSLIVNVPLFLAWVIAFGLLTKNILGVLGHSCSTGNWGNSRGVTVCSVYKTFWAFLLFAVLSQFAHIVLDSRARREQNAQGRYDRMQEENLKLETFDSTKFGGHNAAPADVPYGVIDPNVARVEPSIYRGEDNFYDNPHNRQRERSESRSGRSLSVRPGLHSRDDSAHQSSRSDAPMLSNYGSRWANEPSAYQYGRYDSPHRY